MVIFSCLATTCEWLENGAKLPEAKQFQLAKAGRDRQ